MIDALLEYNPSLLRNLLIIYAIIVVLAIIRYGLEKTIFIEHLFYTLSIFVLCGLIGMQWAAVKVSPSQFSQFYHMRGFGLGLGGLLVVYSLIMILVFLTRCLLAKTNYIQVSKKTEKVEIMSSQLWATVNGTIWWGILAFFIFVIGSYASFLEQIKNVSVARIVTIAVIIFIFGTPFYLIGNYTKWIQKLINVGPIKRRIVKVQNQDKSDSILEK